MVRRFINASKIKIYKKKILPLQPTAVSPYIPQWTAVLPGGYAAAWW
jgi:hypothetical protein